MLFRFRAAMAAEKGIYDIGRTTRPKAISSVESITESEKWRGQVMKELNRKMTKIQELTLSDYQLRDLNDEINKLQREKFVWEMRIRDLGGPNYARGGVVRDADGREVPGASKGYRYYGRAKDLPGVKELFEAATKAHLPAEEHDAESGLSRAELTRRVDASYFGYNRDEEDGTLLEYELQREADAVAAMKQRSTEYHTDDDWDPMPGNEGDGVNWAVPTLEGVEHELIDRSKRRLLDQLG